MKFSDVFGPIKWQTLICAIAFFVLPLIKFLFPQEALINLMLFFNLANTLVIFITGISVSISRGFVWYFPIVVMVLFAFSMTLYYNSSMYGFMFVYLILSYISLGIGGIISKIINRNS